MIKEFSTFGSCASRGIFNSKINKNYKKYFHINYSIEASSLISLMSKPITGKEKLIDTNNSYFNTCVTEDITKNFINFLKEYELDYLILDTYFEVVCPVIKINKNQFITSTSSLEKTTYYQELLKYPKISIQNNFEEFYNLYAEHCNKFFKFLEKNCENIKVILNGSRSVYKHLNKNGKIVENLSFKKLSYLNDFRDTLDKYILENFDVEYLPFDNNTLYDENYLFGAHHTHYETKYFKEKTKQLNEIIKRNDLIPWGEKINAKFRETQRNNIILNWKNIKLKNEIQNVKFPKKFYKYITARIDIKNEGSANNDIEIIENTDSESSITNPLWFKNELGIGTQIQSKKGKINLKIKCINDGTIKIFLRGVDAMNEDNVRTPIYIYYTNFNVNDKNILLKNVSVCHDKPIVFKKEVKHSEILDINIKWIPF